MTKPNRWAIILERLSEINFIGSINTQLITFDNYSQVSFLPFDWDWIDRKTVNYAVM